MKKNLVQVSKKMSWTLGDNVFVGSLRASTHIYIAGQSVSDQLASLQTRIEALEAAGAQTTIPQPVTHHTLDDDTDATSNSNVTFVTEGGVTFARFAGNGELQFAHDPVWHSDAITVSIWMRTTDSTNRQYLWAKGSSDTTNLFRLDMNADNTTNAGKLLLNLNSPDTGQTGNVIGNRNVADGAWHNAVVALDINRLLVYIDGMLDFSTDHSNISGLDGGDLLSIGNIIGTGSRHFTGDLDDFKVWHHVLTSTQITALYNAGQ